MREMEQTLWREGDLYRKQQAQKKPRVADDLAKHSPSSAPEYGRLTDGLGSLAITPVGPAEGKNAKRSAGDTTGDDADDHKLPYVNGSEPSGAKSPGSARDKSQGDSLRARRHEQSGSGSPGAERASAATSRTGISWTRSGLSSRKAEPR